MSDHAAERRLVFHGHVLRMPPDSPAQKALDDVCAGGNGSQGFKGRPITLASILNDDLKSVSLRISSSSDLITLRAAAADRRGWSGLVRQSLEARRNGGFAELEDRRCGETRCMKGKRFK